MALEKVSDEAEREHRCDICNATFFGTPAEAKERGWELAPTSEICGDYQHS